MMKNLPRTKDFLYEVRTRMFPNNVQALSFVCDIDDPHDVGIVTGAVCVLSEVHLHVEHQAMVAIFKCWRNEQSMHAGRLPFTSIQITCPTDKGGKEFFDAIFWSKEEGRKTLENFVEFCKTREATGV